LFLAHEIKKILFRKIPERQTNPKKFPFLCSPSAAELNMSKKKVPSFVVVVVERNIIRGKGMSRRDLSLRINEKRGVPVYYTEKTGVAMVTRFLLESPKGRNR
jgi:hypothetical protein